VDPANARRLAERYFGPLAAKPLPRVRRNQEPPQYGPKTVAVWGNVQPLLLVGYKRPAETQRDDPALDLIQMILGDRRTGWMHKELVEEKRIAQNVEVEASFPSNRNTSLFLLSVTPAQDRTPEENRKAIDELVTRLQSKPMDSDTLARAKLVLRARIVRTLGSNRQLAALLPLYHLEYGSARRLFRVTGAYDRLTGEDLQRVALQYMVPSTRTTAYIGPEPGTPAPGTGGLQ
jgi:zinc protease